MSAVPPAGHPISVRSGQYTNLGQASATSAALGNGTLRAAPCYVPKRVTLDRIGAEITAAGDAASVLRLGIYSDNGNVYPGALLLDAGTISGGSIGVKEIAISQVLDPGVYWLAGAVQNVTTTQPTVRIALEYPFCPITTSAAAGIPNDLLGLAATNITGAFPTTLTTITSTGSGIMPRIFLRAA